MIYFKRLDIARRWTKLLEACSGLKVNLLDAGDFRASHKLSCASGCSKRTNPCTFNLSKLPKPSSRVKVYTYPCPYQYKVVVVPVLVEGKVIGLVCAHKHAKNTVSKNFLNDFSQLLYETMNYLYKFECPTPSLTSNCANEHSQEILKRASLYIREHYYRINLSLDEVAKNNNVSYYYLSHVFTKYMDMTFIQFLTKVRIEKSTKLLKNLKLTVSQVAYAVGYADSGYFCRVFKKHLKMSPTLFRSKFAGRLMKSHKQSSSVKKGKKKGWLSAAMST